MAESPSMCPGRDGRMLTAEDVACPECGYGVEFFSDEKSRRCPSCGFRVKRAAMSDCGSWCPSADQCALLRGIAASEDGSATDQR